MKTMELRKLSRYRCEICDKKATSIIRTMFTCSLCFRLLQKDNIRLNSRGLDIPSNLIIEKNCSRYRCTKKIIGKANYLMDYCSKKCEKMDYKAKRAYNTEAQYL